MRSPNGSRPAMLPVARWASDLVIPYSTQPVAGLLSAMVTFASSLKGFVSTGADAKAKGSGPGVVVAARAGKRIAPTAAAPEVARNFRRFIDCAFITTTYNGIREQILEG